MDEYTGKRFSRVIDIGKLERETRKFLYSGILIALFLNVCGMLLLPSQNSVEVRPARPEFRRTITTDIVVIPARGNASPFTVTAPQNSVSGHALRNTFCPGASLPSRVGAPGKGISPLLRDESGPLSFDSPSAGFSRGEMDARVAFPGRSAESPVVERRSGKQIPLRDEMLTVKDFAWAKEGVRTGLIEYNPGNKLALRGIVTIPIIYDRDSTCLSPGIMLFQEELQKYTDLTVGKIRKFALLQNTQLDYPFLYLNISDLSDLENAEPEIRRLHDYIAGGGFVLFECTNMAKDIAMRQFVRKVVAPRGRLRPLPDNHPVYTCYFDYPDGVPGSAESMQNEGSDWTSVSGLDGVEIDGHLVAVYSTRRILNGGSPGGTRMAVNLLVYALRQDGGFATKREDPNLEPGAQAQRNIAGFLLSTETGKQR